jgi:hypothetical protein
MYFLPSLGVVASILGETILVQLNYLEGKQKDESEGTFLIISSIKVVK